MKKPREIKELDATLTDVKAGQGSVNVRSANIDAFASRLNVLTRHFGSVSALAQKCGFPDSTVRKWAGGVSDATRERCIQLAQGTGASLLWVVVGEGPMWAHETTPTKDAQPAPPLDMRALTHAIALAQEKLTEAGITPDPEQLAQEAGRIYQPLAAPIQRLGVKAAAAQLATAKEPRPTSE